MTYFDEEYIKLCSEYAQNLCDNNVPVIFDFKHLSLLLGYETAELAFYLFAEDNWFYKEIQIPKNYPKVIILTLGLVSLLERVIK